MASRVAAGGASDTGREPALLLSISSPITCPRFNFLRPLCGRFEAQSEERTWPLPPLSAVGHDGYSCQTLAPSQCPRPNKSSPHSTASTPALHSSLPLGFLTGAPAGDSVPNRSACCTVGKGGTGCGQGSQGKGDQGVGSAGLRVIQNAASTEGCSWARVSSRAAAHVRRIP